MAAMAKRRFSDNRGPSQRQLRVGELIRRTISDLLMHGDVHDPDLNRLSITVAEVRVTPDLRIATVFVMPLGGKNREEAIAALKRNKFEIKRAVAHDAKLKWTPDLRFRIDDTFDQMDATRALFADPRVQADITKPETAETNDEEE